MTEKFTISDKRLLKKHIRALAEVEFFTIPFYLTAVYSFTNKALSYADKEDSSPLFKIQQKALSVAVQEMYHLQLACNLANAFDVRPRIPHISFQAGQTLEVPHLENGGKELSTQLGNLPAVIKAMIEVETPDPDHTFPKPNKDVIYASISDLYHATLTLLKRYHLAFQATALEKDPHFIPDHNQVVYNGFDTQYQFNKISKRSDVVDVTNAVTDQGEGNEIANSVGGPFAAGEDGNILKEYQSTGSRFDTFNKVTHFKRFEDVQSALTAKDWSKEIGGPVFYEADGKGIPDDLPDWAKKIGYKQIQVHLNTIWSFLVHTMQTGFQRGDLQPNNTDPKLPGFSEAMLTFKYLVPILWQFGQTPSFIFRRGVTAEQAQKAMDEADPLCLFHWDERTRNVRIESQKANSPLNSCQGLNDCAGKGWGGIATEKGNGACATADLHTCSGGNSCTHQGGCGFLLKDLPDSEEWIPADNQKAATGGCQAPIATKQVFDRTATPDDERLKKLVAQNVWDQARVLFQQRENLANLPQPMSQTVGDVNYDGDARRAAVQPTSQ